MGSPGAPFRLGPGAKFPSCPPPVGGPGREYNHLQRDESKRPMDEDILVTISLVGPRTVPWDYQ